MRKALLALFVSWSHCAMAAVINFEVQFTPFIGDLAMSEVQTVPGKAYIYLNNVPIEEQDVEKKSAALVKDRAEAFKPNFDAIYKILGAKPEIQVAQIRKVGCLEKAHAAGVRVPMPDAADLDFATTGSTAVVIGRKSGWLYPFDQKAFARLKGEQLQMCAGIALSVAYPPRLVVSKTPDGRWEVVL